VKGLVILCQILALLTIPRMVYAEASAGVASGLVVQGPAARQTGGAYLGLAGDLWSGDIRTPLFGGYAHPALRLDIGVYGIMGGADWVGVRGGAGAGPMWRLTERWSVGVSAGAVGYRAPLCWGPNAGILAFRCAQTIGVAPSLAMSVGVRHSMVQAAVDGSIDWLVGNPIDNGGVSARLGLRVGF